MQILPRLRPEGGDEPREVTSGRPLVRRHAITLAALIALLAAICDAAADPAFPEEISAGTLFFATAGGYEAAPALSTEIRMQVSGVVARVVVEQRFRNSGADWTEATYAFPLADTAAVDRLSMRIGQRLIEGEIREREAAKVAYAEARDQGRRASLVSQSTPNLFTTAVANVGPGETIEITLGYLDVARYDSGSFSLRLPMTSTPRYRPRATGTAASNGSAQPSQETEPQPSSFSIVADAVVRASLTPGFRIASVGSPSHDVKVTPEGDAFIIQTSASQVPTDRDFVLRWQADTADTPVVGAVSETVGDTTYVLLMIVPPAGTQAYGTPPREVVYVVDTSGSMEGESLHQAQAALGQALRRLGSADRFNVFRFDSDLSSLYRIPAANTSQSLNEALSYVAGFRANGGTEMEPAIRTALAQPETAGMLRQVVLLTDGGIANEIELFSTIRSRLGAARLFTIGIGSAPNTHFMRKAAQFGRGTYTHIASANEVGPVMDDLFAKLEHVALTDVLVDWPSAVELFPPQVPDLYLGEPIVVVGAVPAGNFDESVQVVGMLGGNAWSQDVAFASGESAGVAALWAKRKIEHLLDSRVDGVDESLIRRAIVDTALEHGIVSRYTSLIAIDRTPARSEAAQLRRTAMTGLPPAGTALATFPRTATWGPTYRLVGLGLLAVACLLSVLVAGSLRRRDNELTGVGA